MIRNSDLKLIHLSLCFIFFLLGLLDEDSVEVELVRVAAWSSSSGVEVLVDLVVGEEWPAVEVVLLEQNQIKEPKYSTKKLFV